MLVILCETNWGRQVALITYGVIGTSEDKTVPGELLPARGATSPIAQTPGGQSLWMYLREEDTMLLRPEQKGLAESTYCH